MIINITNNDFAQVFFMANLIVFLIRIMISPEPGDRSSENKQVVFKTWEICRGCSKEIVDS